MRVDMSCWRRCSDVSRQRMGSIKGEEGEDGSLEHDKHWEINQMFEEDNTAGKYKKCIG